MMKLDATFTNWEVSRASEDLPKPAEAPGAQEGRLLW